MIGKKKIEKFKKNSNSWFWLPCGSSVLTQTGIDFCFSLSIANIWPFHLIFVWFHVRSFSLVLLNRERESVYFAVPLCAHLIRSVRSHFDRFWSLPTFTGLRLSIWEPWKIFIFQNRIPQLFLVAIMRFPVHSKGRRTRRHSLNSKEIRTRGLF